MLRPHQPPGTACEALDIPDNQASIKAGSRPEYSTDGELYPTDEGAPQGGVISPLLANIALHGMERAIIEAYKVEDRPQVIRYADDFAVLHPTEKGWRRLT